MTKLTEIFESYVKYHGKDKEIYIVIFDERLHGFGDDLNIIGIYLESHKAKLAKKDYLQMLMDDIGYEDEDFEETFKMYNDTIKIVPVRTGNFFQSSDGRHYGLINMLKHEL